jgi:hypothetical protein
MTPDCAAVCVCVDVVPKTRLGGTCVAEAGELKVNGEVGSEADEVNGVAGDCGEKGKPSPVKCGLGTSNDIEAKGDSGAAGRVGVELAALLVGVAVMLVTSTGSNAAGCCWSTTMGVASLLSSTTVIKGEGAGGDGDEDDVDGEEDRMKPDGTDEAVLVCASWSWTGAEEEEDDDDDDEGDAEV